MIGNRLEGVLEEEEFSITGGVKLTGTDLKMTAESLVYQHDTRQVTVTDNSAIKYKKIEAEADQIVYKMEENTALLTGNVIGEQDGRKFSAEEVTIDLTDEKIKLSGRAKLIFPDRGEN
jgi:lipopolysaccharide export system protein LptA